LIALSLGVNVFERNRLGEADILAINEAQKLETLCLRNFSANGLQQLRLPTLRSLDLVDWSDFELERIAVRHNAKTPEHLDSIIFEAVGLTPRHP